LGGGHHDDAGRPAAGDHVPQQPGELLLLPLLPDGGRVVGDLVDHDDDHVQPVGRFDLPPPLGGQPGVAQVHFGLQRPQRVQSLGDAVADEPVGQLRPQPELDLLAVQQPQPRIRAQRHMRQHVGQRDRLARAGFASGEQVPVDQRDLDPGTVLVNAQVHRLVDGQPRHRDRTVRCGRR
jgi:hypothetical protein